MIGVGGRGHIGAEDAQFECVAGIQADSVAIQQNALQFGALGDGAGFCMRRDQQAGDGEETG
jgi:hypothetical protein